MSRMRKRVPIPDEFGLLLRGESALQIGRRCELTQSDQHYEYRQERQNYSYRKNGLACVVPQQGRAQGR